MPFNSMLDESEPQIVRATSVASFALGALLLTLISLIASFVKPLKRPISHHGTSGIPTAEWAHTLTRSFMFMEGLLPSNRLAPTCCSHPPPPSYERSRPPRCNLFLREHQFNN